MIEETATKILQGVREYYSRGFKSSNKIYVLNEEQSLDADMVAKAQWRNENRLIALSIISDLRKKRKISGSVANCHEMAMSAAGVVIRAGSTAHLGVIEAPGDHSFCVADYCPESNGPKHVQDMFRYDDPEARIIDPWMNITCRFSEYPALATARFRHWSSQGKHIIYSVDEESRPYNPTSRTYSDGFFKSGPLKFVKIDLALNLTQYG